LIIAPNVNAVLLIEISVFLIKSHMVGTDIDFGIPQFMSAFLRMGQQLPCISVSTVHRFRENKTNPRGKAA
jgi:hypothetical protein